MDTLNLRSLLDIQVGMLSRQLILECGGEVGFRCRFEALYHTSMQGLETGEGLQEVDLVRKE